METKPSKPECKLVIAGPGAGKTHNMVQKVLECMETLHPTKFCVVITYTNAATEEIKSRLAQHVKIPANVFIGTIHSFLNRFVIIPYLSLLRTNINTDKTFLQISSDDIVRKKMNKKGRDVAVIRKRVYEHLNLKGLITFDQTIDLAIGTLKNIAVKNIIYNRLQYLFIDEFQDIDNKQFSIIETIRKGKKTKIYCVGDPEQYISGFRNSKAEFKNIPILKICDKNQYQLDFIYNNHRCSYPIIDFLNNFNSREYRTRTFSQEKVQNQNVSVHKVHYILSNDLAEILTQFKDLYEETGYTSDDVFILAKRNPIVKKIQKKLPIFRNISNNQTISSLQLMISSITTLCKKSEHQIITEANISKICFRKFIVKCIKKRFKTDIEFKEFIESELEIKVSDEINENQHSDLISGRNTKIDLKQNCPTVSNIHNAKGLEKKVVLCIAKEQKELEHWLECNSDIRAEIVKNNGKKDKEYDDYCRLGYVAFSRAEESLCIACLEKIDDSLKDKIKGLGIEVIGTNQTLRQGALF
jgi:DNA helicase-2/ATP-dependent DNA helicase PcrA